MSPHFAPRKDTTKRHVLFIGWSPASCIIDRRKREGGEALRKGEKKGKGMKGKEGKGRKGRGKEGRREHSFLLPFGLSLTQPK